jgi:ferredoxin
VRVTVDPLVCEANGVCERLAPEVYELDENDELHIKLPEPPAELWAAVRESVDSCPKQALTIEE